MTLKAVQVTGLWERKLDAKVDGNINDICVDATDHKGLRFNLKLLRIRFQIDSDKVTF